jgi:gamma-glutamylcyclotransferase (GGCT)/AIG2-like uncharacterized protein YtfP
MGMSEAAVSTEAYLFVYGTLRRGYRHPLHAQLSHDAEYAGMAHFAGRLYDLGGYPGAVPMPDGASRVVGELYRLRAPGPLLALLDRYEGCTDQEHPAPEYRRERNLVQRAAGGAERAWMYLYNRPTAGLRLIASGDFLAAVRRERNPGRSGRQC